MADTKIEIGLSPEEVIASLTKMGDEVKRFQLVIQEAIGKKSSQAINDLKDNAEKGTNQITKFFSNMGTRIREDLKTAFDVSSILAGAKFAKDVQEGVKSVYDMERAFDRLNVRMGLSTQQMEEFKRSAGRAAADAGVKLQDIQPGLLSAASRGNVKDPQQMALIAGVLGQAKQINPDLDSGNAMDDVAEILKRQHLEVSGANVRATFDAINAATVSGGFKNSNDAAAQLAQMAASGGMLGLDTRHMAGLAAVASKSGDTGENILRQILAKGTDVDRGAAFNGAVGTQVFKDGKLDARALGQIDTSRFGNISPQVLEKITGVTGASGADFKQFIETMRDNGEAFDKVINGTNETATEFTTATDSWAAKIDLFKARVTNAGAEVANALIEAAHGNVVDGAAHLGKTLQRSGGDLALAGGLSLGAAVLSGGGIRSLLGSKVADAQGVQKVYVTNAGEMKNSGLVSDAAELGKSALKYSSGALTGAGILLGSTPEMIAMMGAGAVAGATALGAGALAVGAYGGYKLDQATGISDGISDGVTNLIYGKEEPVHNKMSHEDFGNIMHSSMLKAMQEHDKSKQIKITNPSAAAMRGVPQ